MGKIIAIGGGEIGRPGYPVETTEIDKEIMNHKPGEQYLPAAGTPGSLAFSWTGDGCQLCSPSRG